MNIVRARWHGASRSVRIAMLGVAAALVALSARAYERRDITVVESYHANGQRAERREYRRGLEHGVHRGWHANGVPRFVFRYESGVAVGVQEEWYPSGTPYTRFEYRAGHEAGRQQMWTDKGVLRANYVVDNGRRYGLMGTSGCTGSTHQDTLAASAP